MIKFDKPTNLNGIELMAELNAADVKINGWPEIDLDNNLFLDIAEKDEAKAKLIVAAHNGTMVAPEPTIQQKLENIGLNFEDLKAALGL
jgi:hypothetical protein